VAIVGLPGGGGGGGKLLGYQLSLHHTVGFSPALVKILTFFKNFLM
jgi:hypothetical protein